MSASELEDWLLRLESLHPSAIELGLERVATVADKLNLLPPQARVVTVAGTNGKGSTVAVLEVLAREAGVSCGVYSSPHLLAYNERVRIDGRLATDAELVAAFAEIEAARAEISLTYFEFGTLAALLLFQRAGLELLILEVGLGGRLDAVNIVDPQLAIITSISIDHQDWLGSSREGIGREKAGILRPGIVAVIADPEPPQSVLERVAELGCEPIFHDPAVLSLGPGSLRSENVTAAWQASERLGFAPSRERLRQLLPSISCPGRLQQEEVAGRKLVFDVAHNPAATGNLAQWLGQHAVGRRVALFSALSDKDIHAMILACRHCFDDWYVMGLEGVPRALSAADLRSRVSSALEPDAGARVVACDDPAQAWQRAMDGTAAGDTLVIFGSFFTVAAAMQLLEKERSLA